METRTIRRVVASMFIVAAAALTLTACAPVGDSAQLNYSGWPDVSMPGEGGSGEHADGTPHAMWLGDGGKLAIITYGSGNCPAIGTTINVVKPSGSGNTVEVKLEDVTSTPGCTRDLVPHTTEFWTPQNISTAEPLKVVIGDAVVRVPIKGAGKTGGMEGTAEH